MKKLFFTLMLAVICGLTSFGQRATMTTGVYSNGARGIDFILDWSSSIGGTYQLRVYFTDSDGYYIESTDQYRDSEGSFCFVTAPMTAGNYCNIRSVAFISDAVLSAHLPRGGSYQAWLQIISGGKILAEADPFTFTMS